MVILAVPSKQWTIVEAHDVDLNGKFATDPSFKLKKGPMRGSCTNPGHGVHMEGVLIY